MTSTSCLENETAAQLIRDALTAIRNNNKRPDGQSVFGYINKTSATYMDQKYITSVINGRYVKQNFYLRQTIKER